MSAPRPLPARLRPVSVLAGAAALLWAGIACAATPAAEAKASGWLLRVSGPGNTAALCMIAETKPEESGRASCAMRAQEIIHHVAGSGTPRQIPVQSQQATLVTDPLVVALVQQNIDASNPPSGQILGMVSGQGRISSLGPLIELRLPHLPEAKPADARLAFVRAATELAGQLAEPLVHYKTELAAKDQAISAVARQQQDSASQALGPVIAGVQDLKAAMTASGTLAKPSHTPLPETHDIKGRLDWLRTTLAELNESAKPRTQEETLTQILYTASITAIVLGLILLLGWLAYRRIKGERPRSKGPDHHLPNHHLPSGPTHGQRAAAITENTQPAQPGPPSDIDAVRALATRLHRGTNGRPPKPGDSLPQVLDNVIGTLCELEILRQSLKDTVTKMTGAESRPATLSTLAAELASAGDDLLKREAEAANKVKEARGQADDSTRRFNKVKAALPPLVSLLAPTHSVDEPIDTVIDIGESLVSEDAGRRELRLHLAAASLAWNRLSSLDVRDDLCRTLRLDTIRTGLGEMHRSLDQLPPGADLWGNCLSSGFSNLWLHNLLRADVVLSAYFRQTKELRPLIATVQGTASAFRTLLATQNVFVDTPCVGDDASGFDLATAAGNDLLSLAEVGKYQEYHKETLDRKVTDVTSFGYTTPNGKHSASKVVLFNPSALGGARHTAGG